MDLLLIGAGWVVAALVVGLWWGERGRRIDAQWQTRTLRPPSHYVAAVDTPDERPTPAKPIFTDEDRQGMVETLMRETGLPEDVVAAEAERLLTNATEIGLA